MKISLKHLVLSVKNACKGFDDWIKMIMILECNDTDFLCWIKVSLNISSLTVFL